MVIRREGERDYKTYDLSINDKWMLICHLESVDVNFVLFMFGDAVFVSLAVNGSSINILDTAPPVIRVTSNKSIRNTNHYAQ